MLSDRSRSSPNKIVLAFTFGTSGEYCPWLESALKKRCFFYLTYLLKFVFSKYYEINITWVLYGSFSFLFFFGLNILYLI